MRYLKIAHIPEKSEVPKDSSYSGEGGDYVLKIAHIPGKVEIMF